MAQTSLSKVTFGNNVPGWATAISEKPAVIVLQVKDRCGCLVTNTASFPASYELKLPASNPFTGMVGSDR